MIGYFGNIVFEVSAEHVLTFNSLTGKRSGAYAIHNILDGKQKLQYLGQNLQERSLTIRLTTNIRPLHGKEIRQEISKMAGMVNSGSAWPLVLGHTPYGRFVLEGMDEDETIFNIKGDITSVTITLHLREYN